ncbi:Putative protein in type-1 retrotransposable element R1DM [Araneus ventricosus]|uniref:Retrovirus-related Pol polyprotein from type-1 retrotransposable element R1 n=1 Tax=Araneus ventricosus TaxID=182803 RepID=A0A4Y2CW83_ARAVE|nr:Putative protein in type-1 retrotransposable element R1DM [Araneus ventricosus]GBM07986.1 Putative protein in type-1 retrotransposable element R1DM [Araneus ventricosus]GBM07991.1 Putative protein in type-1 retrotransposable element R1DM [Araneus ventricosus]
MCRNNRAQCLNCAEANRTRRHKVDINHYASDSNCPVYQQMVQSTNTSTSASSQFNLNIQPTRKNLKILQINLARAKPANLILHTNVKEIKPDIILIQEPYIKDQKLNGFPSSWTSFTSKNLKAAILIPNATIKAVLLRQKTNTVAIKIHLDSTPLTIVSSYSSPAKNIQETLQELRETKASIKTEPIFIGADLDGHNPVWGYAIEDTRGREVLDYVLANDLFKLNTPDAPPTYVRRDTKGWPDLSLCSGLIAHSSPTWGVLETPTLSDHFYIVTTFNAPSTSTSCRRYKTLHGNHQKFLRLIAPQINQLIIQINNIENQQQLNEVTRELQNTIIKACDGTYKIKKTYYLPNPNWWTQELEMEKKRLRALRRRVQRARSEERIKCYIVESKEKAKYKKKIKRTRTQGWRNFCEGASNPYGKHYKAAFRRAVFPSQLAILENNQPTGSLTSIAERFLDEMFPHPSSPANDATTQSQNPDDPPFTKKEVTYVIKNIPAGKAPGIDGIDNLIIKILHSKYPYLLTSFFNKCLDIGVFPDLYKLGNIVFFLKQGKEPTHPSSYRPISLLPAIGKVLERLLTQRLTYHLEKTGHLSNKQFGFREGKSVDTALESLLSRIKEARATAKHSIVLSIDIKGAFDNLHHDAILTAIRDSPCPANIQKVFVNLLQNRNVSLQSPTGPIIKPQAKGCPQGSCSGPALWNLVANSALNIQWPSEVHIQAFADDFAMVIKAKTKENLKQVAQTAINTFNTWCETNYLEVAPEKTQFIIFSKMVAPPRLLWKGVKIKKVNSIKYLGVYIDDKLNWRDHIAAQAKKAVQLHQSLNMIAGKNWGIPQKQRRLLYKSVVERTMAHGAAAWCLNPTSKMVRKLTSIQRPFLLSLTGAYRTSPTAALQTILGIPPLHLQLQYEARLINLTRLQKALPSTTVNLEPNQIETKVPGWASHPSNFLQTQQISLEDAGPESNKNSTMIKIFTDGSKSEDGVGAAFCVFINNILQHVWKGQLSLHNTVFQAELSAIKEAIKYAVDFHKNQQVKIFADNQASIKAISNPKSKSTIARIAFTLLLDNPKIHISWIKAHANYSGNEKADSLAKEAITTGTPYNVLHPVSYVKTHLRKLMLSEWQDIWKKAKQVAWSTN